MQGRRGMDQLNHFLIRAALIMLLVALLCRRITILYILTYYGGLLILFYGYFRMLSRNIYKREIENNKFLAWRYKRDQKKGYQQQYQNVDFERFVYFQCPSCGQKIRIPRGKGMICITCPKCRTEFTKKS